MNDPLRAEAALTIRAWVLTSLGLAVLGLVAVFASGGAGLYLGVYLAALAVAFGVAARRRFRTGSDPFAGMPRGQTLPLVLVAAVMGAAALLAAYVVANP